eukprot:2904061-Alexandrium_andersonii.AAC.1
MVVCSVVLRLPRVRALCIRRPDLIDSRALACPWRASVYRAVVALCPIVPWTMHADDDLAVKNQWL